MVYFFLGVVRHYIKQMKIKITIWVNNVCYILFVSIWINIINKWHAMLMKLFSWFTTNATPRVGSYRCHSTLHGVLKKKFCSCDFWCVDFWVVTVRIDSRDVVVWFVVVVVLFKGFELVCELGLFFLLVLRLMAKYLVFWWKGHSEEHCQLCFEAC